MDIKNCIIEIFKRKPEGSTGWFCSIAGDPGGGDWTGFPYQSGLLERLPPPRNNFLAVSAFREVDGRVHRRIENWAGLLVVVLDDIGPNGKIPESRITLEPTFKVETSPGNFQYFYVLDEPITHRGAALALLKTLHSEEIGLSDPGINGLTQYVRLPDSMDRKPHLNGGIKTRYIARSGKRYNISELVAGFGLQDDPSDWNEAYLAIRKGSSQSQTIRSIWH